MICFHEHFLEVWVLNAKGSLESGCWYKMAFDYSYPF
jgi:hypothetical protein